MHRRWKYEVRITLSLLKYVNIKPSAASLLWPLNYIKSVIKAILFLTGNTCEFHTSSCGCGATGENIQSKGGKADPFNLMVKWNFSSEWNFYHNKPSKNNSKLPGIWLLWRGRTTRSLRSPSCSRTCTGPTSWSASSPRLTLSSLASVLGASMSSISRQVSIKASWKIIKYFQKRK